MQRRYNLLFHCMFDLIHYPFDEQVCYAHLRLATAFKGHLMFHPNLSSVEYTGSRKLLEYEVGRMALKYIYEESHREGGGGGGGGGGEEGISEVWLRVHLTRLSGHAIINIYTPSLILLAISYLTLFFSPAIFEVRIMASLTSLLVMATFFTQMARAVALVLLVAGTAAAMKLYEKHEDKTYRQVLVPVSSTVIPLDDLPVYKVGVGVGVGADSPISISEKLRPEGPVKLVTIHSLKRKNKKKAEKKDPSAALIEELTEEEYRILNQKEEK